MQGINKNYLILFLVLVLIGCGGTTTESENNSEDNTPSSTAKSNGYVQKGPFQKGSTVKAYYLENGQRLVNDTYLELVTQTIDDKGNFNLEIPWNGVTEYEVSGNFLDENTGNYRANGLLTAIVNVNQGNTKKVNINIFTHLASAQIKAMLKNNRSFEDAKNLSKENIKKLFNLDLPNNTQLEDLDLLDGLGDNKSDNTILLEVSAALLNTTNPKEALNKLYEDMIDGNINYQGKGVFNTINENISNLDFAKINSKLADKIDIPLQSIPNKEDKKGKLPLHHNLKFETIYDTQRDNLVVSNPIIIKNLQGYASLKVHNGFFSKNNNEFVNTQENVKNGDIIRVKHRSSSFYNKEVMTYLTIGNTQLTFSSFTEVNPDEIDTIPNDFSFETKYKVNPNDIVQSDEIVVSGISEAIPVTIYINNGAKYSINNEAWQSGTATVVAGDIVKVQLRASNKFASRTTTKLTIGEKSANFDVYTRLEDKNLNFFTTTTIHDAKLNLTYETGFIKIDGYSGSVDIEVINGEAKLEGTTLWKKTLSIPVGNKVTFRQKSASTYSTEKITYIKFGDFVTMFKTITQDDPNIIKNEPHKIKFNTKINQQTNVYVYSNQETIRGLANEGIEIFPSENTDFSINSNSWTNEKTRVYQGDKIKLRVKTANTQNALYPAYVYYGDERNSFATFNVFTGTKNKYDNPDDISFDEQINVALSKQIISNEVVLNGMNDDSCAIVAGGEYQKNDEDWKTQGEVCFRQGDRLKLRHTSSNIKNQETVTLLSFSQKEFVFKSTTVNAPIFLNTPLKEVYQNVDYAFQPKVKDEFTLTYSLINNPSWMSIDTNTGRISGKPLQEHIGESALITLKVVSQSGLEKTQKFKINVIDVNDRPILSNTWSEINVDENSNFSKNATAVDVEGGNITWSLQNNPSWLSINSTTGELSGTPKQLDVGTTKYIKVLATEEDGLSASFMFNLTVIDKNSDAVILPISNKTIKTNEIFNFTPSTQDLDGDTLTFFVKNKPSWLTFDEITGKLSGTPTNTDVGTYKNIGIGVTDGIGASTFWVYFNLTVELKKIVPTLTPLNLSISETTHINTAIGTLSFENGNTPILSMNLSGEGSNKFDISKNGEITLKEKVSFTQKSQYLLKAKATNIIGESLEVDVNITILEIKPLDSLNFNVEVKGSQTLETALDSTKQVTIKTNPSYGTAQTNLIGNETWGISYTNTSCFIGEDSFSFEQDGATGIAQVTINANVVEAINKNFEMINTNSLKSHIIMPSETNILASIKTNPTNGTVTIKEENGNIVFDYDPSDTFVGTDSFVYTITTDINGCTYTKDGTISIKVKGLEPEITTLTNPVFTTLLQEDLPNQVSKYGFDVAIEDDIVVVSSPYKAHEGYTSSGEVIIYKKVGEKVQEIQRLISPSINSDDSYARYGYSISLKDDLLAVSSFTYYKQSNNHYYRSNLNKVFVYKKNQDDTFSHIKTIASVSSDTESYFAKKVAINKNYLLISATKENESGFEDAGVVYVYKILDSQVSSASETISSQNPFNDEYFGTDVTLLDDLIIISSAYSKSYSNENDNYKYGEVFVYKEDENGTISLKQSIKPEKSIKSNSLYPYFGVSLHSDGQLLAIGATGATIDAQDSKAYGAVYVYSKKADGTFEFISKVVDEDKMEEAEFGKEVAIEDSYLVVHSKRSQVINSSDLKNLYGFTHIYQYNGNNEYKKIKRVDGKKAYSPVSVKYKEKPYLGFALDISNGIIIAGAAEGIVNTPLNTLTFAGRAYLLDVDPPLKPYLLQDKFYVQEGNIGFKTIWSSNNGTVTLSGNDAAIFNIDEISSWDNSSYIWLKNSFDPDMPDEPLSNEILYDNPQDSDSNNIYEMTINLTKDNQTYSYPIKLYVRDRLNSKVSTDSSKPSYAIYRNKPDISGIKNFASDIAFGTDYVYANSLDSIYIYTRQDRNSTSEKFLDYNSSISVRDDKSNGSIKMASKDNLLVVREAEDIPSTLNDLQYKTYLTIYEDLNLKQKILFSTNTTDFDKNVWNSETKRDFKYIRDIKLDEDRILVKYQNSKFDKKDVDDETDDVGDNRAGIKIYKKSSNGVYELIQDIIISPFSIDVDSNYSFIRNISANDGYLVVSYNSHIQDSMPKRDIKIYKFNPTSNLYEVVQTIQDNTISIVNIKDNFLTIKKIKINEVDYIDIYKLDDSTQKFVKIDTLSANDAGANNLTDISNVKIDGNYLFFRFAKLVDPADTYYDAYTYSTTNYIAVFKFDESENNFKFLKNLTVKGAGTYFAQRFEVDNQEVIANEAVTTLDSGQLYILRFEEKQ